MRSPFNICVVMPPDYVHSYAFFEVAELLYYSLKELGLEATMGFNRIEPRAKNLLIGVHLLERRFISEVPSNSVVLNTEPLRDSDERWNDDIYAWAQRYETWDYNPHNIEVLKSAGISHVKRFEFGYQKELRRIVPAPEPNVDVLFYGVLNERRKAFLVALEERGLKVKYLFGAYGKERDQRIAQSKLVLNLHRTSAELFEVVRVFYLLTNSIGVVSEVNQTSSADDALVRGVCAADKEQLVDRCVALLEDPAALEELRARGLETIMERPQAEFTKALL